MQNNSHDLTCLDCRPMVYCKVYPMALIYYLIIDHTLFVNRVISIEISVWNNQICHRLNTKWKFMIRCFTDYWCRKNFQCVHWLCQFAEVGTEYYMTNVYKYNRYSRFTNNVLSITIALEQTIWYDVWKSLLLGILADRKKSHHDQDTGPRDLLDFVHLKLSFESRDFRPTNQKLGITLLSKFRYIPIFDS